MTFDLLFPALFRLYFEIDLPTVFAGMVILGGVLIYKIAR